jgi:nicotinamidase/pyrazinamidase
MANTKGAEYVPETDPENPLIFDWNRKYPTLNEAKMARNIVIRKDAFDVFTGSPHTDEIVKLLAPKTVVVYGVTTNVCVNDAVVGLTKRVDNVLVVEDAIKELPNIPLPFENWKRLGVKIISSVKLDKLLA